MATRGCKFVTDLWTVTVRDHVLEILLVMQFCRLRAVNLF